MEQRVILPARPELQLPLRATLSRSANRDLIGIAEWSIEHFGRAAADRYRALIEQALADLGEDPFRAGVKQRPYLPQTIFLYPLAASRDRVAGDRVKAPRHLILFSVRANFLQVLRILHESRDLTQHYPA